MKKIIYNLLIICTLSINFISCGVTTGEVIQGNTVEENTVKAGRLPILQICPGDAQNISESFDFFMEPESIEESENNIIVIKTNEQDVEVYLNNTYQGKSDIKITDLVPGSYILDLKKEGYKSVNTFVSVNRNRKNVYFINMEEIKDN